MKQILLLLLLLCGLNAAAQTIVFADPAFKAKLLTPAVAIGFDNNFFTLDVDGDGEIQVNEAVLVKLLRVTGGNITSLAGVENFSAMQELECYANNLTSLNLSNMPNLLSIRCEYNAINSISLTNMPNLAGLACMSNSLATLNLSGLTGLIYLNCANNQLTALDFSGLPNLRELVCDGNELTSLDFSNNPQFDALFAADNDLQNINFKNGFLSTNSDTNFPNNPNLTFICADEGEINLLQSIVTGWNMQPVNVNSYCWFPPGGNYNTITGTAVFDGNNNGCDANDVQSNLIRIDINDANATTGATFTDNGNYSFYVTDGNFTLTPSFENAQWFNINPASAVINFPLNDNSVTQQNFCLTANGIHPDVEVVAFPISSFSPGFESRYLMVYRNKGNQTLSGNVTFAFDGTHMSLISAQPTPDLQASGLLTYNYTNLLPLESRSVMVWLLVNSPSQTPAVNIGDSFNFTTTINPIAGDETPSDNSHVLTNVTNGPYDPNVKRCLEGEYITPDHIGNFLHYNINFENIGNEAAQNVVVRDTIDGTRFDIGTLQVIHSSHPVYTRILGNVVEFIFENINLPSAISNPIGGHGNVLFKIKTLPTLTAGDIVTNIANIYFDYNHPIETNEARTTFANLKRQEFTDASITLYPNPTKGNITISAQNKLVSVTVFDVQGRVLQVTSAKDLQSEVDLTNQTDGIYYLKITTEKGNKIEKIIKQ